MTSKDSGNDLRTRIARSGIATLLLIGLMALALAATGCGGSDTADSGTDGGATSATKATGATAEESTEKTDEKTGAASDDEAKSTFTSTCGGCHTLADAGTKGTTGPNLDDLKPDAARVEAAIKKGGTSGTVMPKNLLEGDQAKAVADYVSSVAGQ